MELKTAFETIDNFHLTSGDRLEAARQIAASGFKPDMDAVCEIDLHCHSFCSDGYYSPANKVFEAYRRNMKAIAISDHDLFDGQEEAIEAGRIFKVDVIPAIEFYTDRPGIEIIGHFPDKIIFHELLDSGVHEKIIEPIREAKKKQLGIMIKRIPECFKRLGFDAEITSEDIDKFVRNGVSTKGDISVIMWQKYGPELRKTGISSDVKDFQAKYTTRKDQIDVALQIDMDLSPKAFVKRILGWGGLPGLPHPTELRKKEGLDNCELRKVIADLADAGLQTIEVDGWRNGKCPETGMNQTDLFNQMRIEYNSAHPHRPPLLFTNGSDDHNQPGEGLELGCGHNRNLRPEFGKHGNLQDLLHRFQAIQSER
ncbi:MAG TPA: hypothetical protein DET40_20020 [Lentisphaeria bacterium]|nr:MAG: hypothetical protein A2X45_24180 [Lentisphaerae bacterium GWF2_50_93]HCE45838.1 hypothetical protein [Lentisphaeria bacterium]